MNKDLNNFLDTFNKYIQNQSELIALIDNEDTLRQVLLNDRLLYNTLTQILAPNTRDDEDPAEDAFLANGKETANRPSWAS